MTQTIPDIPIGLPNNDEPVDHLQIHIIKLNNGWLVSDDIYSPDNTKMYCKDLEDVKLTISNRIDETLED